MGRESRFNGHHIVQPGGDRTFALADVSKQQLAVALNEQSARFMAMREQLKVATRVIAALVLEPESFRFADGRRTIDAEALKKVKDGMTLRMDQPDLDSPMVLTLDGLGAPTVDVPRIIVPAGGL